MIERDKLEQNRSWAEIRAKVLYAFAMLFLLTSCKSSGRTNSKSNINLKKICKESEACENVLISRRTDLYYYHCWAVHLEPERSLLESEGFYLEGCPEEAVKLKPRQVDGVCQFLLDDGDVNRVYDFEDTILDSLCIVP